MNAWHRAVWAAGDPFWTEQAEFHERMLDRSIEILERMTSPRFERAREAMAELCALRLRAAIECRENAERFARDPRG